MYTVTVGDDGMFSAEYVVPAALSIPLGTSGSAVDVVRNEDGSYSANGEVITAETMVTAANGNVYAAVLSPEGVPVGVMHVAAMQDVMLGNHGGTVTVTQAENMSWSIGEQSVMSGSEVMSNDRTYILTQDAEGMWSAMYKAVFQTAALGTQGSVTLEQAEDMTWWDTRDSSLVDVGTETMSDNGNRYTWWYNAADGVWTARFEPATMEIKGTGGVMVFSREADDMWDVESAGSGMTLAADEPGEITTSAGAMYRVSMMDGMLSGVRFDGAPKGDTVHVTVGLYDGDLEEDVQVSYIADDRDTAFNEANTKITVAGEKISLGDLLGSGSAMKAAAASDGLPGEFVNSAVDELRDLLTEAELYAKYQAAADDDPGRSAFDERLNSIAERAQGAVDMIFGTNATDGDVVKKVDIIDDGTLPIEATESATDYVRATQTVRGLNRLLDALSSADAFVAATKGGNNGVFENALGEDAARDAFSANKSEYMVYFGTTENTRYGAIALKERKSKEFTPTNDPDTTANEDVPTVEAAAVHGMRFQYDGAPAEDNDVEVGRVGAFSYATVNHTLRSRNLLQTGGAVYTGGTVAATPAGTLYSGDMRIDVNFRAQSVFGRVSDLRDKDNNLWKYLDSDVDTIYLPRQNYNNWAQFGGPHEVATPTGGQADANRGGTGPFDTATIVYSQSQGFSTRPTEQPDDARFAGRFIDSDGAEITGTWSLGQPVGDDDTKSNDLDVIFGSYGVTRQDSSGPVGPADGTAGGRVKTTEVLPVDSAEGATPIILGASFEGDADTAGILRLGKRSTGGGEVTNNDFELTRIFAQPGANPKKTDNNSPTHVSVVVDHIEAQRAIYVIYAEQVGGDSKELDDLANVGRQNAWKSINDFVLDHIFNVTNAPEPTGSGANNAIQLTDVTDEHNLSRPLGSYHYPMTRSDRPDDDAALARIDTLLAAFADQDAFADALKPDGGGVFDSQPAQDLASTSSTYNPFPTGRPTADIFNQKASQTRLHSLSTAYTRFGVWFRRESPSAVEAWGGANLHSSPEDSNGDNTGSTSPGSYAYSYLSQSTYRVDRPVATYPSNGLATYEGKTLANTGNTQAFVGDALIRVTWEPLVNEEATSKIVPIFSNFERVDNSTLDRLMHGGKVVDEIAFRASENGASLTLTHVDGKLGIDATDASVEVVYTDGTSITTPLSDSTFNGKFVGSSGDGPLGVLGTWKVPGFRGASNTANDLIGSFGADLTSFETALP